VSDPYVGEIRLFAGTFAPAGWSFCDGSTLAISEYDTLFNLIGTTYGGDGQETFQLPNLASRVPVHQGPSFVLGQTGGEETVTLTTSQLPQHSHPFNATTALANQPSPGGNLPCQSPTVQYWAQDITDQQMAASMVLPVGGSQPHENMHPFLVLSYIISLFGIYPSPS